MQFLLKVVETNAYSQTESLFFLIQRLYAIPSNSFISWIVTDRVTQMRVYIKFELVVIIAIDILSWSTKLLVMLSYILTKAKEVAIILFLFSVILPSKKELGIFFIIITCILTIRRWR